MTVPECRECASDKYCIKRNIGHGSVACEKRKRNPVSQETEGGCNKCGSKETMGETWTNEEGALVWCIKCSPPFLANLKPGGTRRAGMGGNIQVTRYKEVVQ